MMKKKLVEKILDEYNKLSQRVYNIARAIETTRSREYNSWCVTNDELIVDYNDWEYGESYGSDTRFPVEWLWSDWETKLEKQKEAQEKERARIEWEAVEKEFALQKEHRRRQYENLKKEFGDD